MTILDWHIILWIITTSFLIAVGIVIIQMRPEPNYKWKTSPPLLFFIAAFIGFFWFLFWPWLIFFDEDVLENKKDTRNR